MKKIKLLLLVMFAFSPTLPADAAKASVSTFACPRCQAPLKNKDALYYHNRTSHQKEIAQEIAEKKQKLLKALFAMYVAKILTLYKKQKLT